MLISPARKLEYRIKGQSSIGRSESTSGWPVASRLGAGAWSVHSWSPPRGRALTARRLTSALRHLYTMLLSRRIGGVVRSIRRPCSCSRRVAPPIRDHSGVAAAAAGVASGSAAILEQLDPALSPAAAYAHLVEAGLLRHDDHQVDALAPLEQLYGSLAGTRLSRPPQAVEAKQKTTPA